MITIEIDGRKIQADEGAMVIEAADQAGIYIPRFCYHKKLSIAANCRMCLVEVEKARKPLPACATPVTDGMKVFTKSPMALSAQKGVMEFLLINHPLDCPICDQGGECELQDIAMGYGRGVSRYSESKRAVPKEDIGPLIETEMTRCIHCTRCVRFGEEVAGLKELGATGRGEHMRIGTFVEKHLQNELSGNVIDLCPVGALTAKPYRYQARPWEMRAHPALSPHDCVGSNLEVHTLRHKVMRVVPRENESINETWIADRDRFSYEGLYHPERLTEPMIKENGEWHPCDWETALERAGEVLRRLGAGLGGLISPSAPLEEQFLFARLVRALGSEHVDYRLGRGDTRSPAVDAGHILGEGGLAALESREALFLVGADLHHDQPMIAHRVRKAWLGGADIAALGHRAYEYRFGLSERLVDRPSRIVSHLERIAKALVGLKAAVGKAPSAEFLKTVDDPEATHRAIAELVSRDGAQILVGTQILRSPAFGAAWSLLRFIAEHSGAALAVLPEGANAVGAAAVGAVPKEGALGAQEMLAADAPVSGFLLHGVEPEFDAYDPARMAIALRQAEAVIALTAYRSPLLLETAQVLLPIAAPYERAGGLVNVEGRLQRQPAAVRPLGEARPGWKVLRVIGSQLQLDGFDYLDLDEVHQDAQAALSFDVPPLAEGAPQTADEGLERIGELTLYGVDAVVRRAPALQELNPFRVAMNAVTAGGLGLGEGDRVVLSQGGEGVEGCLEIDEAVPTGAVYCPVGVGPAARLGAAYGCIDINKINE